jgi:hypothetical protein
VGNSVGYVVGGGKRVEGSLIALMTDAALVNAAQRDPDLRAVSVLIIDEAHERSLNTDIVLGIARLIRERSVSDRSPPVPHKLAWKSGGGRLQTQKPLPRSQPQPLIPLVAQCRAPWASP